MVVIVPLLTISIADVNKNFYETIIQKELQMLSKLDKLFHKNIFFCWNITPHKMKVINTRYLV